MRHRCWESFNQSRFRRQPDVVRLAPVCGPWSVTQNINDPRTVAEKGARFLPMIDFVASIARYQWFFGRLVYETRLGG